MWLFFISQAAIVGTLKPCQDSWATGVSGGMQSYLTYLQDTDSQEHTQASPAVLQGQALAYLLLALIVRNDRLRILVAASMAC